MKLQLQEGCSLNPVTRQITNWSIFHTQSTRSVAGHVCPWQQETSTSLHESDSIWTRGLAEWGLYIRNYYIESEPRMVVLKDRKAHYKRLMLDVYTFNGSACSGESKAAYVEWKSLTLCIIIILIISGMFSREVIPIRNYNWQANQSVYLTCNYSALFQGWHLNGSIFSVFSTYNSCHI